MRIKKHTLKLALVLPVVIGFLIYANIYQGKQEKKYNQFISSPEGKARIVRHLLDFEGIKSPLFERYLKSKTSPLVVRNLDLEYRVETVLQYALKELQSVPPDAKENFANILSTSSKFKIGEDYYEEYQSSRSLDEKIAVIKVLIKHHPEIWGK